MILAIIDMQTNFQAARDNRLQKAIVLLIEQYRRNRLPIICVQYGPVWYGRMGSARGGMLPTVSLVKRALRGYDKIGRVVKFDDNGASEIIEEIACHGWEKHKKIALVGVNTSCCVGDTAFGLRNQGFIPSIIHGCCADSYEGISPRSKVRSINNHLKDSNYGFAY